MLMGQVARWAQEAVAPKVQEMVRRLFTYNILMTG